MPFRAVIEYTARAIVRSNDTVTNDGWLAYVLFTLQHGVRNMILIGGAGAMADAAKAMRKIQKRIDRRASKTRRRAMSDGDIVGASGFKPERVEFACAYLCGTCGYLIEHPAEASEEPPASCPACGDEGAVDLAIEPLAERVRQLEADERANAPTWVKQLVGGGTSGLMVALCATWFATGHPSYGMATIMAALFVVPLAYVTLPRAASVWLLSGRTHPPHRWHEPLGLPEAGAAPNHTLDRLEARAVDDTLEAPISQRECLAYQVCVLFDVSGDARPPEWALQEQRATHTKLGDALELDPDELYLESPVELVETLGEALDSRLDDAEVDSASNYDELKQFLRQRGLFSTEGEFHLYEAVLEPGDLVHVDEYDEMHVLRHESAMETDELPDLPEISGE